MHQGCSGGAGTFGNYQETETRVASFIRPHMTALRHALSVQLKLLTPPDGTTKPSYDAFLTYLSLQFGLPLNMRPFEAPKYGRRENKTHVSHKQLFSNAESVTGESDISAANLHMSDPLCIQGIALTAAAQPAAHAPGPVVLLHAPHHPASHPSPPKAGATAQTRLPPTNPPPASPASPTTNKIAGGGEAPAEGNPGPLSRIGEASMGPKALEKRHPTHTPQTTTTTPPPDTGPGAT